MTHPVQWTRFYRLFAPVMLHNLPWSTTFGTTLVLYMSKFFWIKINSWVYFENPFSQIFKPAKKGVHVPLEVNITRERSYSSYDLSEKPKDTVTRLRFPESVNGWRFLFSRRGFCLTGSPWWLSLTPSTTNPFSTLFLLHRKYQPLFPRRHRRVPIAFSTLSTPRPLLILYRSH